MAADIGGGTTILNTGFSHFLDPSGAFHPIHPPWKQEVARRTFLAAQNIVYGDKTVPKEAGAPTLLLGAHCCDRDLGWSAFSSTIGMPAGATTTMATVQVRHLSHLVLHKLTTNSDCLFQPNVPLRRFNPLTVPD